jgi:hypothetical protein
MAKYQKLDEPVFITNVELIGSKHGGEVYEVKLKGIKTQKDYKTYIDPLNNNFHHWEWIIEAGQRKGVVLSNAKLKDPVKGIVNADSQIRAEYVVTKEELADILADYWKSQDKFQGLFGEDA